MWLRFCARQIRNPISPTPTCRCSHTPLPYSCSVLLRQPASSTSLKANPTAPSPSPSPSRLHSPHAETKQPTAQPGREGEKERGAGRAKKQSSSNRRELVRGGRRRAAAKKKKKKRGKMLRGGTSVLGIVNFITFLISIPILGGGIWLASRANSTDCIRFLQWPIIVVGLVLMVISLMGFAGACYRQTWLLRLYLFAMFFVVLALLFFIVFAFAVTDRGDGQVVMNRRFLEYQLSDYSGWLRERVADPQYWATISACLRDGHACSGMRRLARDPNTGMLVPETPGMFYARNLSPIQSGCCKPPSSCAFTYNNETYWTPNPGVPVISDPDCNRWSNDQQTLCFQCDSCKAGVLAGIKKSWRKVAILNIVVLIILVIVYVAGCAAFRNAKRIENDEPIGMARMTKSHPSRFQF